MYSHKQIAEIKQKIINKIFKELDNAIMENEVNLFLDKYSIVYEESNTMFVDTRTMKILVFGAISGRKKDYQALVKKYGIDINHVVFESDYMELKKYPVVKLRNSTEYSDILYGPVPHSQSTMGDFSSFLSQIESSPSEYPRLVKLIANDKLKITKTNFEKGLQKTRYFKNL